MMTELFPDSFVSCLRRLRLNVKAAPSHTVAGTHLSRASGASLQFRDYQAYAPGDDLRRVDWNVYRRTRHLFVRRFERPTAVPVVVLVDASASMLLSDVGSVPTRYATAARLAAAVLSSAMAGQNPTYLSITGAPTGAAPRVMTGRRGMVRALADLSARRVASRSGISDELVALQPLLAANGPGVLVVVSDFFDDHGAEAVVNALRPLPGRLVLLQVTQPGDPEPEIGGDVEMADCERDARLQVWVDREVLQRYREAYRSYFDILQNYARARGATLARFDAARDTLGQLDRIFPAGILTV